MADKKISELTQITGADVVDSTDELVIVDTSAGETKAITRAELFTAIDGSITLSGTVDGRDVAADGSKLDGIEPGATADQTAGEIKAAYESNADTNAFTDAEQSKLSGIEAGADVTNTANVTAAGALMDSEVANLAAVKSFDPADYAGASHTHTLSDVTDWPVGLADLSDIDPAVGNPSDGDILVYRVAGSDWVLETKPVSGSNPALADITDWPASVTATEVSYLDGVTSAIQTQLDDKVDSDPSVATGADAITNIISLTQAEYDAITPNASTLYVIV